jgi:NAD(P)-dependent dehydrogenase (short-subunit alcohol dehydrogenase family)
MSQESKSPTNRVDAIRQSPPINTSEPYDPAWVGGKTILITGGASGFGEGFFRKWAENGANVIIGDINNKRGEALVAELRQKTGNQNLHYIHCNVTDWQSQVDFFRQASRLSPHGGIDAVVANAGITEGGIAFAEPTGLDVDAPPKPNFKCYDVNLTGVLYTAQLALFWLPRNPRSQKASPSSAPAANAPGQYSY